MQGIMFIPQLFKSTIAGLKTETRRVVSAKELFDFTGEDYQKEYLCNARARYKKGEIVYLKEPYIYVKKYPLATEKPNRNIMKVEYCYDKVEQVQNIIPWKNKMFMPAAAARYYIEILDVYIEKLNDITEMSAVAEGIKLHELFNEYGGVEPHNTPDRFKWYQTPIEAYKNLWDWINVKNAKKGKQIPWESNPWVFVYKYKLTDINEKKQ